MSAELAIGVGCRAGCAEAAIAALIGRARTLVDAAAPVRLFSIVDKRHEPGLVVAASKLGLDLVFLPIDQLRAVASAIRTPSPAAQARFGVPSVSEAAALAGAGPGAVLVLPRIAADGVTCAVAIGAAR